MKKSVSLSNCPHNGSVTERAALPHQSSSGQSLESLALAQIWMKVILVINQRWRGDSVQVIVCTFYTSASCLTLFQITPENKSLCVSMSKCIYLCFTVYVVPVSRSKHSVRSWLKIGLSFAYTHLYCRVCLKWRVYEPLGGGGEGRHPFSECTFGGVYVPCIYSHARWELP